MSAAALHGKDMEAWRAATSAPQAGIGFSSFRQLTTTQGLDVAELIAAFGTSEDLDRLYGCYVF